MTAARLSRLFKLYIRDKKALRHSIDQMLSWDFERIVVGPGHLIDRDGRQVLKEAYSFLR